MSGKVNKQFEEIKRQKLKNIQYYHPGLTTIVIICDGHILYEKGRMFLGGAFNLT